MLLSAIASAHAKEETERELERKAGKESKKREPRDDADMKENCCVSLTGLAPL